MKKIPLSKYDLEVVYEKLESGLEVYVVKKDNVNGISASLTTPFGGNINEFIPIGQKKMEQVPLGVAHFLEHQMFHMEDDSDPMAFFSQNGAYANAMTGGERTSYIFSGTTNFSENLNYLLYYVASPCFTDESVEKEKGIIIEELKMYVDKPYSMLFQLSMKNCFKTEVLRQPTIGTISDIKKTTKEDLIKCYETFYHPSNMFLIVTGNVEPTEVIAIARDSKLNQEHKKDTPLEIKVKENHEPDKVVVEYDKVHMDVVIPKISINYKINISQFSDLERRKLLKYLIIIFSTKFGSVSPFLEEAKNDKIINDDISYSQFRVGDHLLILIEAETKEYDELLRRVEIEMSNLTITPEEFERKKKVLISNDIASSDNIYNLNDQLEHYIIHYHQVIAQNHDEIKALNYAEMREFIKKISLKNRSVVVIDCKKKNEGKN